MHPDICIIANELFYDKTLVSHEGCRDESELEGWYRRDWGADHPVILLDTGKANAWVSSVSKRGSPSRLNFLSATLCVDLAEAVLIRDNPDQLQDRSRRILIICPYAPHAKLLKMLIKEQGLEGQEKTTPCSCKIGEQPSRMFGIHEIRPASQKKQFPIKIQSLSQAGKQSQTS